MFSTFKSAAVLALLAVASADGIFNVFEESVCIRNQAQAARCLNDAHPIKYQLAQAVARVRLGKFYLTGWLWGSEGHLVTNHHNIPNEEVANKIRVELGSECSTCADPSNNDKGGCVGTFVADSTTLVFTDKLLDVSLLKLNLNPGVNLTQYGYLQARAANASLEEEVYLLGHPFGKPKQITFEHDDGTHARIISTSTPSICHEEEEDKLGYNLDTESGSSGSPVLGARDNKVVALHNCWGCHLNGKNTGHKMTKIVALLRSQNMLPKDAVADEIVPQLRSKNSLPKNAVAGDHC
ncbi:hypothetical protein DYB31_006091 [Aphanomyces astaci]|uniref:Serine protease n=1 Tax=Aphanomyces astaci TaxID=112090 RepID=A0A397FSQ3_APHAT|nr:hypothetical protein DYB31_006091 [Aphanomyces astaci]